MLKLLTVENNHLFSKKTFKAFMNMGAGESVDEDKVALFGPA